jgi:D-alanine transaminase
MAIESQSETLYLNGTFMPLSDGRIGVEDRGFELGDGVYEVIKILNGRLVWLGDHLERLNRSLAAISLSQAIAEHDLAAVLPELAVRSGLDQGMVYLQITRGWAPRNFVFPDAPHPTVLAYARSYPQPATSLVLSGISLHPVEDQRWARCDIKSTNLLAAVLAKEEARKAGAYEALFMAPDGMVREGGSSNVFAFLGGVLRTHPANNRILAGITRKHVLEIATRKGYRVEESAFLLTDLAEASDGLEVFTASTLGDVLPVVRIGGRPVGDGRPGPLALAVLDEMRREQAALVGLEPPGPLEATAH